MRGGLLSVRACGSAGNSANSPVTASTVCSAMSMVLLVMRFRQRATRIMNLAPFADLEVVADVDRAIEDLAGSAG